MYLRHSTVRKGNKTHTYWRLVRSVRRDGNVCQETVAQLGELDAGGRARARLLARTITGRSGEQRELFEPLPSPSERVAVDLPAVRLERGRRFGDVWLGHVLWQSLRLDRFCQTHMPQCHAQVPWSTMAEILTVARLCEPSSELHIAEDWYRRTALEDVLGVPCDQVNDDRLYRALDQLLPHREALQVHLKQRLGELFDLDYELLLYDVTRAYFEGMPLGYEVFSGNRVDVTTVQDIVDTMEHRYGVAQRVWVMDRGMVSADNIAWLQQSGRRYLIGANKQELKR